MITRASGGRQVECPEHDTRPCPQPCALTAGPAGLAALAALAALGFFPIHPRIGARRGS